VRSIFDGLVKVSSCANHLSDPAFASERHDLRSLTGASLVVGANGNKVRPKFPNTTGSPEYFPLELTITVSKN